MTSKEIVAELKTLGSASIKKTMSRHGAREPVFGVKIEDLKKIQKRIKKNHELALDLYDTGISDAMYLAGLIADDARMTQKDLQRWIDKAYWPWLSEYTVPWVAAGSPHGRTVAWKWIDSDKESVAAAGWATLAGLVSTLDDSELDVAELKRLLSRVEKTIHQQPNRVRYVMNSFVIAAGGAVAALTDLALKTARKIGPVDVDMGDSACKVPGAEEYIKKVQARGAIGKKRKSAKC
jgi:3-methyladenine DNA glycosylase AlkD